MVRMDMRRPEMRVVLTSGTEARRGEVAGSLLLVDHEAEVGPFDTGVEPVDGLSGSCGGMRRADARRATYPDSVCVHGARKVQPTMSSVMLSRRTTNVAVRVERMCFHSCSVLLKGTFASVIPAAVQDSSTSPVRRPPTCIAA